MPVPSTSTVPSRQDIELADYKIGSFISDLDMFQMRLERCQGEPITPEEFLRREAAGEPLPESPPLDRNELAALIVFATDALNDCENIQERARDLRKSALALYREATDDETHAESEGNRERLADWHRNALRRLDRTGDGASS